MALRSPICVVVGHVDHGKSSILDYIRGTRIVAKEAGAITQAIGASVLPIDVIKDKCGTLLKTLNINLKLPGLLFIDTPGHAAFTSLRQRGGSLADIAILVVDINEGFMPQTLEALQILRQHKTPFVIAANKIDLVSGFVSNPKEACTANMQKQPAHTQRLLDEKLYTIIGTLYEQGFQAERYDRITDFTKQLAVIPVSAMTGDGMSELLMVMSILAQRFLEQSLQVEVNGPAKGTILEVKEQQGLGTVLDTIVYDGTLRVNDTLVIGSVHEPIVTKVRALLVPSSVDDMRDAKAKFTHVKEAVAATGVKISAPNMVGAVAGMPVEVVGAEGLETVKARIAQSVQDVTIDSDKKGVIIKSDTLGGIEALLVLLKQHGIPVRKATIGEIMKKDIIDAKAAKEQDPLYGVILGFNIKKPDDSEGIQTFCAPVIYQIIDDYLAWKKAEEQRQQQISLGGMMRPCKIEYMKNHTFRQSHPAIIGVAVLGGTLRKGTLLMKEGQQLTAVKGIQRENEPVEEAKRGDQVAVSMDGVTAGRQIAEGEVYYSYIDEEVFKQFKEKKQLLNAEEIEILKEIAKIMRESNPVWGI